MNIIRWSNTVCLSGVDDLCFHFANTLEIAESVIVVINAFTKERIKVVTFN
jgi:hypothetical protein